MKFISANSGYFDGLNKCKALIVLGYITNNVCGECSTFTGLGDPCSVTNYYD